MTKYTHYCGKNRLPGIQRERPFSGQEGIEGEDNNFIFIFNKIFIWYWSIIYLQCCASFGFRVEWLSLHMYDVIFCSVQSLSRVQLFATPWNIACQAYLSITNSWSSPKPMSMESVMPSNHLILCHVLLLLPSIFPSFRVFPNESALRIRWPKYWSFTFRHCNEHPGLISFKMDWVHLLAVQGTLKSLLQYHSSKASILQHSACLWSNSHICTWLLEKPVVFLVHIYL